MYGSGGNIRTPAYPRSFNPPPNPPFWGIFEVFKSDSGSVFFPDYSGVVGFSL